MKVKTAPQETSQFWDVESWQDAPPRYGEVRKPVSRVRKHRFYLRPQLVGTILIVIIAFSAGFAIGPWTRPPVTVTVTSTVHDTVSVTTTTCTTSSPKGKWLPNANVVSYLQAANYVGQSKTVEGTIVRTYVSKGTVFLDFHDPYQGYFVAVIFSSDIKNFPFPPDSFYRNKEVRITGTIQLYQGAPEIIVHSPSQIEVANMGFNYP
jgi:hypothetical protein